jgi:hypothetical protein
MLYRKGSGMEAKFCFIGHTLMENRHGLIVDTRQNLSRRSAIDGRTTRHSGYAVSQRVCKRIEEGFGWMKTIAGLKKTKYRGLEKVGWSFTMAAAAYNLIRLPKIIGAA